MWLSAATPVLYSFYENQKVCQWSYIARIGAFTLCSTLLHIKLKSQQKGSYIS